MHNLKSIFKLKPILLSIMVLLLTAFFLRAWSVDNPIFWFILIPSSPPGHGIMCAQTVVDSSIGWPLSFLKSYGGGCEINLLLNPISLILNFVAFLVLGRTFFVRKPKTPSI